MLQYQAAGLMKGRTRGKGCRVSYCQPFLGGALFAAVRGSVINCSRGAHPFVVTNPAILLIAIMDRPGELTAYVFVVVFTKSGFVQRLVNIPIEV